MKRKKWRVTVAFFMLLILFCGMTVQASGNVGNVATAIENTWQTAADQIKTVVNNVVFPAIDLILAVLFFVKVGTAYMDYRKHGQIEWAPPVILFVCLIFTLTAPLYVWDIVGI